MQVTLSHGVRLRFATTGASYNECFQRALDVAGQFYGEEPFVIRSIEASAEVTVTRTADGQHLASSVEFETTFECHWRHSG